MHPAIYLLHRRASSYGLPRVFYKKEQIAPASLQSGFAVTLSLRGPHDGRLGSSLNGPGACQRAACQAADV